MMRIRGSRLAKRLALFAAAAAVSIGMSAMVAAPAQAHTTEGYWDLVAIYDNYYQCLAEGPYWVGGPVIDFTCTYVGGGSTELWVLYA